MSKGTGPWTVEIQITSTMGVETLEISDLTNHKEKLTLQIPREVDKEGGSFQIDLVSVQDAQGCKRSLAVPGLSVHVPRIKVS
jgi:nucleoporin POM152